MEDPAMKRLVDALNGKREDEPDVKSTPNRRQRRGQARFVATRERKARRQRREYEEKVRRAKLGLTPEQILEAEEMVRDAAHS